MGKKDIYKIKGQSINWMNTTAWILLQYYMKEIHVNTAAKF